VSFAPRSPRPGPTPAAAACAEGRGRQLLLGRDLGAASELRGLAPVLEYDEAYTRIFLLLAGLGKPSVAVVQGYAVAGGFTLAMGCDFVLAEAGAQFGALEMKRGFPAALNSAVLAHKTQPRNALELLLSAGMHGAQRLYEMGLVNRVAADASQLARIEAEFVAPWSRSIRCGEADQGDSARRVVHALCRGADPGQAAQRAADGLRTHRRGAAGRIWRQAEMTVIPSARAGKAPAGGRMAAWTYPVTDFFFSGSGYAVRCDTQ